MAVLGLRFCARAFSSCGKWGPLFIAEVCFSFRKGNQHNGKTLVLRIKKTWVLGLPSVISWDPMKCPFFELGCHLLYNDGKATGPFCASRPSAGGPENGRGLGWLVGDGLSGA